MTDWKASLLNWSLLLSLVILWGTSFLFISLAVEAIDPWSIVFFRVVLGALTLVAVMYAKGLRLPYTRSAWLAFLLMGCIGNLVPFFLIAWGQKWVNSGVAGMIMAVMPLITMLMAHYLIEGENLNRYKIIGFAVGMTGIIILLGPVFEGGGPALLGGIAILIAATCYAINTILARRLPRFQPLVAGTGVLIAASITMLPAWLLLAPPVNTLDIHLKSLSTLIWLGIGPTGIGAIIYFLIIERAGPTFLATINYMIPAVAFFAGAWILSEPVGWHGMIALVTILGGIAITRIRRVSPGSRTN